MVSYYLQPQKAFANAVLLNKQVVTAEYIHEQAPATDKTPVIFPLAGCCAVKFQSMILPLWQKQEVS